LYKSQISELEQTIQNHEEHIKKLSLPDPSITNLEEEKIKYEENINELKKEIQTMEEKYEQMKLENNDFKKKIELHQTEKEDLESTIKSLQKKNQSLAQEMGKLTSEKAPPPSSSIWSFPLSPLLEKPQDKPGSRNELSSDTKSPLKIFSEPKSPIKIFTEPQQDEVTLLKEKVQTYEEDLKQLREKNTKLTITLET